MLEDLIKERVKKLENFKNAGHEPYPAESERTHFVKEALTDFDNLVAEQKIVTVAGRLFGLRNQGSLFFADLRDGSTPLTASGSTWLTTGGSTPPSSTTAVGTTAWQGKIQLVVKKENLTDFELFRDNLDIGDFVQASGTLFTTQKGEKSIEVKSLKLLTKSLRPLPDQWSGLSDLENRLRHRYLDIMFNPEVKEMFIKKNVFWETVRSYLKKQKFLEVETPVLELIPGGADAEPFVTHHNALDTDFYLRISLELPLKKLLVAGYEKVFEIGRVFRNEGIDAEHLQDYTECEFYWAYEDYKGLMKFVEKLYKTIVKNTLGKEISQYRGQEINWGGKWPKIDYYKIFKEKTGLDLKKVSQEKLLQKATELGLKPEPTLGRGRLIDLIYKKTVRPHLIQPCFLINPPVDVEPLAKRLIKDHNRVERLQVVACGTELGKGFSETNDPLDQRQRFEEQVRLREQGDKEAQRLDESFLEALEFGMPPAAGFGLSERLFAILMDKPVRETVIFPLMKNKGG